MFYYVLIFVSILFNFPLAGIGSNEKDLALITQRKLIVILENADENLRAFSTQMSGTQVTRSQYDSLENAYNQSLQVAVKKYWHLHTAEQIRFMSLQEAEQIPNANKSNYVVLHATNYLPSSEKTKANNIQHLRYAIRHWKDKRNFLTAYTSVQIHKLENLHAKPILATPIAVLLPDTIHLIYALGKLQALQKHKLSKTEQAYITPERLRRDTILVCPEQLCTNYSLDSMLKKTRFKLKLVTQSQIKKSIMEQLPGYLYLIDCPQVKTGYLMNAVEMRIEVVAADHGGIVWETEPFPPSKLYCENGYLHPLTVASLCRVVLPKN